MKTIKNTLSNLQLRKEFSFSNLTVYPLSTPNDRKPDYATLDEALKLKLGRVTEIDEGGSVPDLAFENNSDHPILLVDGEELIGAKQNRVLNLTILVAAHAKVMIPVSCVEQGRWSYRSREFKSSKRGMHARGRARKMEQVSFSIARSGERMSDQGAVWDELADKSARMGVRSRTGAMSDIYKMHENRLNEYLKGFRPRKKQVGAVFAINGEIAGLELFDSSETFKKHSRKLLRSYAMDAIDAPAKKEKRLSNEDIKEFLNKVSSLTAKSYPALGMGVDLRITGDQIAGGALTVDNRIVHLSVLHSVGHDLRTTRHV